MRQPAHEHFPSHVAIIMDGNGRWATQRGLPRALGHRQGVNAVRTVVRAANDFGLGRLTLFAFSQENWSRPRKEVNELMALLKHYLRTELDEMMKNRIRIRAIGRLHELPADVQTLLDEAILKTREIVDAARAAAKDVMEGRLALDSLDDTAFPGYLSTAGEPDPDLLIRTGGEQRVSNFLLWQIAYTELYVTETLWPDFGKAELRRALEAYASRERRFGLTSDQIGGRAGERKARAVRRTPPREGRGTKR
jgi:undecaprenyl diphosphate synthase